MVAIVTGAGSGLVRRLRNVLHRRGKSSVSGGRAGSPDEIAVTVAFLCSPSASSITGEIINQNGGWRFGS